MFVLLKFQTNRYVIPEGSPREHDEFLEYDTPVRAGSFYSPATQQDFPPGQIMQAGYTPEKRCLAATAGPQEADKFALLQIKREILENRQPVSIRSAGTHDGE
jgi:hypothetical protein